MLGRILALVTVFVVGCNAHNESGDIRAPNLVTFAELASNYESFQGGEIAIEGYLRASPTYSYYLTENLESVVRDVATRDQILLEFRRNPPDEKKMSICLDGLTIVVGQLGYEHKIVVEFVKLKDDVIRHAPEGCY